MGHSWVKLMLLATTLGGCSLIYGPDRLPAVNDAPPADAIPSELTLERVTPARLVEGQGDHNGRRAVLLIHGTNIVEGATVSISAHQGETATPMLDIDHAAVTVDIYHQMIAVPVTVKVDPSLARGRSIQLDVTVTQPPPNDHIRVTLGDDEPPALTLEGLDELTGASAAPSTDPSVVYSFVDITGLNLANRTSPVVIRSMSSIKIGGATPISLSAPSLPGAGQAGGAGGPGGASGGMGGEPAMLVGMGAPGRQGGGPGGGRPNGGGAGFAATGGAGAGTPGSIAGDRFISSFDANQGSGGAGGKGADALVAGGGPGGGGGGGGGTLELTAGADLVVTVPIEANGGRGRSPGAGSGSTAGGGGSGGVVLLRAGRNLTVGNMSATGGPGGGAGGGMGAIGRVRVDSPARETIDSSPPVGYRGPMFAAAAPMVVREPRPEIAIVGEVGALIKYVIEDGEGRTQGPNEFMMADSGEMMLPFQQALFRGYNKICLLVTGVTVRRPEAENCITLAYLY